MDIINTKILDNSIISQLPTLPPNVYYTWYVYIQALLYGNVKHWMFIIVDPTTGRTSNKINTMIQLYRIVNNEVSSIDLNGRVTITRNFVTFENITLYNHVYIDIEKYFSSIKYTLEGLIFNNDDIYYNNNFVYSYNNKVTLPIDNKFVNEINMDIVQYITSLDFTPDSKTIKMIDKYRTNRPVVRNINNIYVVTMRGKYVTVNITGNILSIIGNYPNTMKNLPTLRITK